MMYEHPVRREEGRTPPVFIHDDPPPVLYPPARGTAKTTGKIKAATASGQTLNTVLLGGTWVPGTQYAMATSPSTAIPATPFQITLTI